MRQSVHTGAYRQGRKSVDAASFSTLVGCLAVPRYDADDLNDNQRVAEPVGLQRNTVSVYQRRYPRTPGAVVDLGQGRSKLWLRSEIELWRSERLASAGQ